MSSRTSTITVSLIIAIVLIAGAYFVSGHHLPNAQSANAESTEALLQAYAAKDSDADGLPDWEEALYGTNPNSAHSVRADITDSQAVAKGLVQPRYKPETLATSTADIPKIPGPDATEGSLTDQFARVFFNNFISTVGNSQPTAEQMQSFVQDAVAQLEQTRVRSDAFTQADVTASGSGSSALDGYASKFESALGKNAPNLPYDELTYFADATEKNDPVALKNLDSISASYLNTAQAIAKIPVPQEAATAHLEVINAMARLGATIGDMASIQTDPIRAMLGLGSYQGDALALTQALQLLAGAFSNDGIAIGDAEHDSSFYQLLQSAQSFSTTSAP